MRAVLALLLAVLAGAAEPDLPAAARATRIQAEAGLAEARLRIAAEHADALRRLQAAIAAADAARQRLATVQAAVRIAEEEAARVGAGRDAERARLERLLSAARTSGDGPLATRVETAVAALDARIAALPARLGLALAEERVIGRDGSIGTVAVLRLGEARAVALGRDEAHRGLLSRLADGGEWMVGGPTLPAESRVDGGRVAVIPFDATGQAAQQAVRGRSPAEWLAAGRAFIWPILAVFAVGLGIAIRRALALHRRPVDAHRLASVADLLGRDDQAGAVALVAGGATPLDRVLHAGIAAAGRPRESREAAVEQVLLAETAQLSRGLPAIAVLAGVAPLLGLLGTVTGMIDMFSVIAAQGSGNARSLSGGISEALICTQAGMLVAIPLLLIHAWLGRMAERRCHLLEEAACGVLGLVERKP